MAAPDRRLTMRILEIWKGLAQPPDLPRRSRIDPRLFGADWGYCLMIDVDPVSERSRIAFVGDNLRDTSWPPFDRQSLAECVPGTLLHLATSKVSTVIENAAPVSFGGAATHGEIPILYRAILLPVGERTGQVDGILGAVNFRELAMHEGITPLPEQAIHRIADAAFYPRGEA